MHDPILECPRCGERFLMTQTPNACPKCKYDYLEVHYDLDAIKREALPRWAERPFGLWRYRELLPLRHADNIITMGEGGTPLLQSINMGTMLGHDHIYIKDERQGPTGSFKDRQASLAISSMKEAGITEAVVASTGNVAISYSAYCARAGIKLWAFLTSLVPADKMREVALYGSEVVKITGTYDQCKEIAASFAQHRGLFLDKGLRSIAARQSMKTLAYEVCEQLGLMQDGFGKWRAPDWYIQAVSGGMGPIGTYRGFQELYQLGLIDRMPRIAIVQAAGCAPMVTAFKAGKETADIVSDPQTHIATLATGNPGLAYTELRRIVTETGGTMEMVSDEEAFRAMHVMAKMDGLSVEPATAVAFAGLFNLISHRLIKRDEVVVVNCSGHTFPVEKELLGDEWASNIEAPQPNTAPQEGLLSALERLDDRMRDILIMDDTPEATLLLRRILQAHGKYTVREAINGKIGLEMIRAQRPDLILLDLMMPEMDGFAVLDVLRTDRELSQIPVIVVTAKELTAIEKQRLSGKAQSLMQKGAFTEQDIVDKLHEVLN
ncbi:MAG: pyridoxal-phosphate dependent enzyme [Anaerolineae bacterium]